MTPWTAACQASLSITNSWSLLKLMPIESVMPSSHLIHCHPLLILPSIFPSIRVFPMSRFFTSGGQSIGVSASTSVLPMNIQDRFPLGWTGCPQKLKSCPTLCDPMDYPWNSSGQNKGVGSLSLLQGIFPTQGSNSGLPHCRFFTRRATREAQKVHIKAKFHTALDCSPLTQQKTRSFFFGEDKTVSGPEMPGTVQTGETIFKRGSRAHLHMEFWDSLTTIGYMQILKARDWRDLLQENSQRCWPWG